MTTHEHGDLDNTRSKEQREAYEKNVAKGICPFCGPTENMPHEIESRMLYVGPNWRAWRNPFPYSGHAAHIILAPIPHVTQPSELSAEAAREWMGLNTMLIQLLNLPGGGLVMRFGSGEYKGGSIAHLHSHIQVPNRETFAIATFYADDALKAFFEAQKKNNARAGHIVRPVFVH